MIYTQLKFIVSLVHRPYPSDLPSEPTVLGTNELGLGLESEHSRVRQGSLVEVLESVNNTHGYAYVEIDLAKIRLLSLSGTLKSPPASFTTSLTSSTPSWVRGCVSILLPPREEWMACFRPARPGLSCPPGRLDDTGGIRHGRVRRVAVQLGFVESRTFRMYNVVHLICMGSP